MFSVHITWDKFESAAVSGHFGFVSNSSCLKGVFEKLRFCDGLVWTENLKRGNKASFSNFFGVVETGLRNALRVEGEEKLKQNLFTCVSVFNFISLVCQQISKVQYKLLNALFSDFHVLYFIPEHLYVSRHVFRALKNVRYVLSVWNSISSLAYRY